MTLSLGDWSRTMTGGPFDWRIPAPVVSQAGPVEISAEATDIFGNIGSGTLEIWVEPLSNAVPPEIAVGCPVEGDLVAPGVVQPVTFSAFDDQSIESAWLTIDGERVDELTPVWEPSSSFSFEWTPDPSTAPGQTFAAALEVRDFAGNVASTPVTFSVPQGTVLSGDQILESSSVALALGRGVHTADAALNFDDVTLLSGALVDVAEVELGVAGLRIQCGGEAVLGSVTVTGDVTVEKGGVLGPEQLGRLDVVAQNVTVDAGGVVEGRKRGYDGENGHHPPHLTGEWGPPGRAKDDGGSHAGLGAAENLVAEGYGSVYVPHMAGGGGSNSSTTFPQNGAHGGGIVWIEATGTLRIDGLVDVSGADGLGELRSGAGAGGSVRLVAQRIEGTGAIDAGGGAASWFGGGGGRVALAAPELLLDVETQVRVAGGIGERPEPSPSLWVAGSGSLLVETAGSVNGTLILDGGDIPTSPLTEQRRVSVLTPLGTLGVTATQAQGGDLLLYTGGEHLEAWLGAFARINDAAGLELGTYRVLEVVDGALLLDGAGAHAAAATTASGVYRFDRIEIRSAQLEATDPIEVNDLVLDGDVLLETDVDTASIDIAAGSTVRAAGSLTAGTLTLGDGATLMPSGRSDLVIDVAGTLTVGTGAVIEADGVGYGPDINDPGL
ncbi:MAG: hypothetical protein AAFY88_14760, partial [Acidobacteriota bacterium]